MPRAQKSKGNKKHHKSARTGRSKANHSHKTEGPDLKKRIRKVEAKKPRLNKNRINKIKELQKMEKLENSIRSSEFLNTSLKSHIEHLVKKEVGIKVVLLVPFNHAADVTQLKSQIESYILSKSEQMKEREEPAGGLEFKFPYFHFFAHPKHCRRLVM